MKCYAQVIGLLANGTNQSDCPECEKEDPRFGRSERRDDTGAAIDLYFLNPISEVLSTAIKRTTA